MGTYGHYPYPRDERGHPIDTPEYRDGNNIKKMAHKTDNDLHKAIRLYEDVGMEAVDAALEGGADINATDKWGFTPLHMALKNKNTALVDKFLEIEGVDLNAKTNKGFTPLMVACWKGEQEIVQKLMDKGADVKAKDSAGRNCWGVAHDWHHYEILELFKRNNIHHKEGDVLAFPPAPKWREEHRDKNLS